MLKLFRISFHSTDNRIRFMSGLPTSFMLRYNEFGEPSVVLNRIECQLKNPKDDEVLIKTLAAPINPADINTIQGKYPVSVDFPAVPGNEMIAEVISIGSGVSKLNIGDRVIPARAGLGTWRTRALFKESDLYRVPLNIGTIEGATLSVNPPTAYRMLTDFIKLEPGDTVLQNGGNSAVGQAVSQLCKAWGINCVSVVRDRPGIDNLIEYLKMLGAKEVLTESQLRTTTLFKSNQLKKPALALNCVGGKSSTELIRHLQERGCIVTYGGMSREPVIAPVSSLIFKDIMVCGFWMTRWSKTNSDSDERIEMFNNLIDLITNGQFVGPSCEMVPFANYLEAIEKSFSLKGFAGKKFILDFSSEY